MGLYSGIIVCIPLIVAGVPANMENTPTHIIIRCRTR